MCGAGTVGANLLENLARMAIGPLRVIDCDKVEARNLSNQPYTTLQLQQSKPTALAELLFYAAGVQLETVERRLRADNARGLLKGSKLVVDAFDNAESRAAVQSACRELGLPCLHVGLSRDSYGEVVWDERYRVPEDSDGLPACLEISRNLALFVVAVATEAVRSFLDSEARREFAVTLADLVVSETCLTEPREVRTGSDSRDSRSSTD